MKDKREREVGPLKNGDLCENFIHVPSKTDYKSSLDNIVAIILFSIVYLAGTQQ